MCLSSWATTRLEDVAAAAPTGLRWFQLYVYKDRALTTTIVRRAQAAGYKALVLTVDAPLLGQRVHSSRPPPTAIERSRNPAPPAPPRPPPNPTHRATLLTLFNYTFNHLPLFISRCFEKENDVRNGFSLPSQWTLANFAEKGDMVAGTVGQSGLAAHVASQLDQTLSWKDVAWLRSLTTLPIVVKGPAPRTTMAGSGGAHLPASSP